MTTANFWTMARRPRWIAALVLALAIAGAFAALGQWQLSRSVEGGTVTQEQTETPVPLASIAQPQQPLRGDTIGQRITVSGTFLADDYVVLSGRINHAEPGFVVVGHLVTSSGASLAVAIGWTDSLPHADEAIAQLRTDLPGPDLAGRYLMSESPEQSEFRAGVRSALAVAELINLWSTPPDGVYAGYLALDRAPAGLETIDAPPPPTEVSINLLNVFYAIEWVVFGGFAIFLWYRLVRDAVEAQSDAATPDGSPPPPT